MKESYCSTCGQEFKAGDLSVRCRLCMRNYHASCWKKTGGCSTLGCAGKPLLKDGNDRAVEYKRCPSCGEKIVSFAVKCRYCHSLLDASEQAAGRSVDREARRISSQLRKDPVLTGLLNLIFPGAGYMYLGQFGKGLFWFLAAVAAWFFTRGLGLLAVYIWVIYDSSRQAIAFNRGDPPPTRKTVQRP